MRLRVLDTSIPGGENVAALREQIGVWPPGFVTLSCITSVVYD